MRELDAILAESAALYALDHSGASCDICRERIVHTVCGCGDAAARMSLTIQRSMRYLDIESGVLEQAARRYLGGDRSNESSVALKVALVNWLDAKETLGDAR